jgi:hypothetical protein
MHMNTHCGFQAQGVQENPSDGGMEEMSCTRSQHIVSLGRPGCPLNMVNNMPQQMTQKPMDPGHAPMLDMDAVLFS